VLYVFFVLIFLFFFLVFLWVSYSEFYFVVFSCFVFCLGGLAWVGVAFVF